MTLPLGQRAVRTAALAVLLTFIGGCAEDSTSGAASEGRVDAASEQRVPASQQFADSAAADSVAFSALSPSLTALLDIRRVFAPAFMADTARAYCQPLGADSAAQIRRRLRVRLGDTLAVLFVRADLATAAIERVELVRRPLDGGPQHGFFWEGSENRATEVTWVADRATATKSASMPRGSPAPRAFRGLGRLLLAAPCTGARRP